MSTESTSNETSNTSSANKRTRINHDSATTVVPTGILKKPSDIKLPIVAAEGEVDDYVKTLHPELQKFAKSLLIAALGHYGPMFWKKIKHNDNKSNPSFAPVSVEKSVKVQLQALSEVEESEEFKALSASLEGDVADFKKMITDKYIIKTEGMNLDTLRNRFISSVCKLLTAMARGFLAEHGVENYSEHQTFIDFFAMSGNDLLCVLKTNAITILEQYKKVNSLVVVPEPTVAHNLQWLLNQVNGPPPSTNTAPAAPAASTAPTAPAVSVSAQSRSDMSRASALARATVAGLGNHPFQFRPSPYDSDRGSYVPHSPSRGNTTPINSYVTNGRMIFPSGGANSTTGATNNNTNQGNINNVSQSNNTHQATNAAVAAAQVGGNNSSNDGDAAMTGNTINSTTTPTIMLEVVPANSQVPANRQVIISEMKDLVVNGLGKSVKAFDNAQELSSTSKRIKQSTKPTQLKSKAERIAAVVAADTPQDTPVIRGIIQEEVSKSTADLKRELQSSKARLANAEQKLQSSKGGSNNNKSKNNNGGGSKKVATNKQKQNHSQSHRGKGNGTKPAAKNNNNNNKKKSTGKKSNGKGHSSGKKKHN